MKQKIMNSTILTNETGRSMVEMLGVLAIVGVLSVGAVYGYGVALKKRKANELLHQASMLATTISAQILTDKPLNVQDFGNGTYGTFGTPTKVNDEQFEMKITGVDPAVCEQVAKMSGGMVREAECNDTILTLTYNNNLSTDKVAADYNGKQEECEESGNKYCEGSGSCLVQDKDCCAGYDSQCCVDDGDISSTESCVLPDGSDGKCNNGECVVIMGTECGSGYYSSCEETGGECVNGFCKCPSGTVFSIDHVSGDRACLSCSDLEYASDLQTCEACGKVGVYYYPDSYPDGNIWACFDKPSTECKSNEMFSAGTCVPCSAAGNRTGGYYNGVEQCEKCGLENNGGGICIKKCPAGTIYAYPMDGNYNSDCYSCNTEAALSPAKGNCSQICPNRNDNCELVSKTCIHGTKNGDSCVCESGWYGKYCESDCDGVKDEFGYCHMCSYSDDLYVTSIDECHNCDDRIFYGNTCASCSDESDIPCDKSECDRCPNRVYENGVCRLKVFRCLDSNYNEKVCQCSDITPTNSIRTNDSAECEKCDGVKYWMGSSSCGVIDCGTGYIQSAFGGVCVPINTTQPTAIMVDPEYADTCNSLGWFYAEGGFCCNSQKVKECKEAGAERPSDCPSIKLV